MPSQDDPAHDEQRGATPTAERDAPVDTPFAKPVDEVCSALEVDPAQGLSDDEARRRLERHGPNELREARTKSPWRILLDQFMSTVILVLVAAGVVAVATARWEEAIAIAAVVLVNAGIGFTTEWRAVRAMNALRVLARPDVRVRRGGRERSVDESKLVPGDIVVLESGDRVPADLRLLEANGVRVDEASLTGESVAVTKRMDAVDADAPLAERTSLTYRGTLIGDGSGEGVVTATGMATELGRISELAESAEAQVTPLQRRLDHLGRRLAVLTIAIAVLVAVLGLVVGQDPRRMIETAIALGVAAIPEGLPIVATIALARGMWLLARRNALVDRLPAVETLGATQVIFTDKTGTLTENRMTLTRLVTEPGEHRLDEAEGTIDGEAPGDDPGDLDGVVRRLLETGALCTNAEASGVAPAGRDDGEEPAQEASQQGDPTELALLRGAAMVGIRRGELLDQQPEEREVAFDAELMLMATFHRRDGAYRVAVKGAPGAVLERCDTVAMSDGDRALGDEERSGWLERSEKMAGEGLRVLGIDEGRGRRGRGAVRGAHAARPGGAARSAPPERPVGGPRVPRCRHRRDPRDRRSGGDGPGDRVPYRHRRRRAGGRDARRRARGSRRRQRGGAPARPLDPRVRARRPGAEASAGRDVPGRRTRRGDDRRRRERRAGAQDGRYRRGDGPARHRRRQTGGGHDSAGRRVRDDRGGDPPGARDLRQHPQVGAVHAVHEPRRGARGRGRLGDRRLRRASAAVASAPDPLPERPHRRVSRVGAGGGPRRARGHEPPASPPVGVDPDVRSLACDRRVVARDRRERAGGLGDRDVRAGPAAAGGDHGVVPDAGVREALVHVRSGHPRHPSVRQPCRPESVRVGSAGAVHPPAARGGVPARAGRRAQHGPARSGRLGPAAGIQRRPGPGRTGAARSPARDADELLSPARALAAEPTKPRSRSTWTRRRRR